MTDPIAAWRTEHAYFGRLLALLQKQIDVFHRGAPPNYQLMLDIVSYLRDYTDQFHHPREDVAFARLAKHCPDMALALARLHQEHRVIAKAGETFLGQLQAVLNGALIPRAEIEVSAATYLVYYGNHIAKEEEDVLARAAETLTAADWEAVRTAIPQGQDPLSEDGPEERYRELRRQIALEA